MKMRLVNGLFFLEKILIWCRKYGGDDLKLIYNDNNNTLYGMPQSKASVNLFKALKKEGIPIDGIGLQCHTKILEDGRHMLSGSLKSKNVEFDAELFVKNLKNIGESGAEIYISECDVHLYGEINEEKYELQTQAYKSLFGRACM